MATLGSLIISLEANTAKFEAAMTKAQYTAKKSSDAIKSSFIAIGTALAGAFSISAFENMVKGVADMESAMLKMAGRLNTSVETLSSFGVMIRKTGMDTDAFYLALTRLEKGMSVAGMKAEEVAGKFDEEGEEIQKTAGAYDQLGLNVSVLLKMPLADQLKAIAEGFKNNIDPADRVNIAMQLFGKTGAGMINILKGGAADIDKWIKEQESLGIVTTEAAKKASEFNNATKNLTASWQSFVRQIADAVIPTLADFIGELDSAIRKMKEAQATKELARGAFGEKAAADVTRLGRAAAGEGPFGEALESFFPTPPYKPPPGLTKPPVRPGDILKGGGGKGGGGGGGLDQMQSIIDTLQKDLSRLTEGSLAEIREWATHVRNEIEKVGKKGAETEKAMALAAQVEAGKKKKVTEDYELFVARESGDAYKQIEADAKDWLTKYKGFADAEINITTIKNRKKWEEDNRQNAEKLSLQKSLMDAIVTETPYLSQQLALKEKMLPLEIEINRLQLERTMNSLKLTDAQKDEYRGLLAIAVQYKKMSLDREKLQTQGIRGGLQIWAQERKREGEIAGAGQTVDIMKKAEMGVANIIGQGIKGALSGAKPDIKKIGMGIAETFIDTAINMAVAQLFTTIAKIFIESVAITTPVEIATATTVAGIETTAAATSGGILVAAGATVATEMIAGATTAAAILAASKAATFALFGHTGGVIQKAHSGWPWLASDEVPLIAQTGERVLNRRENKAYEAGLSKSGYKNDGGGDQIIIQNYFPNQSQVEVDRFARRMRSSFKKQERRRIG